MSKTSNDQETQDSNGKLSLISGVKLAAREAIIADMLRDSTCETPHKPWILVRYKGEPLLISLNSRTMSSTEIGVDNITASVADAPDLDSIFAK